MGIRFLKALKYGMIAILRQYRERIATPVCALVRNDKFFDKVSIQKRLVYMQNIMDGEGCQLLLPLQFRQNMYIIYKCIKI